jgi:DNA-binding transcriptional ArsR family regulator
MLRKNDQLNLSKRKANHFSAMASLIGEPARAVMLWKLLEGKAYTATELAIAADISAQSTSMHLAKLVSANLLSVVNQGRHRYYRLSSSEVAYVIESISNLVPVDKLVREESLQLNEHDIKYCRTCYDHLAGKVGVAITERLVEKEMINDADQGYDITLKGEKWLNTLNISVRDLQKQKRVFARKCLDWSERRYHVSGSLGAALLDKMIELKWIKKVSNSRRVLVTPFGQEKMYETLRLSL